MIATIIGAANSSVSGEFGRNPLRTWLQVAAIGFCIGALRYRAAQSALGGSGVFELRRQLSLSIQSAAHRLRRLRRLLLYQPSGRGSRCALPHLLELSRRIGIELPRRSPVLVPQFRQTSVLWVGPPRFGQDPVPVFGRQRQLLCSCPQRGRQLPSRPPLAVARRLRLRVMAELAQYHQCARARDHAQRLSRRLCLRSVAMRSSENSSRAGGALV